MYGMNDLVHDFSRFGPFVLVALWAGAVALMRRARAARRPPEAAPAPVAAPRPPQRRRPVAAVPAVPAAVSGTYAAFQQRAAPPAGAPALAEADLVLADLQLEPDQLAASLAAAGAEEHRFRFGGSSWAQAIVLAEVVGPPLALRRPGTLHMPSAF
jgi:hypothetical protein